MNKFITTAAILLATTTAFAQSDRVQCAAKTKKGEICKNLALKGSNCCHLHDATYTKPTKNTSVQCSGITKSSTQCKNRTTHASGKCHHHR